MSIFRDEPEIYGKECLVEEHSSNTGRSQRMKMSYLVVQLERRRGGMQQRWLKQMKVGGGE